MLPTSYLDRITKGSLSPAQTYTIGCLQPKRILTRDTHTLDIVPIDVNCGKCINCVYDAQQQWVSRMCLHSINSSVTGEPYNYHCYFITLTYAPFDHTAYIKHPYKSLWLETMPVLDSHNKSGKPAWTPSILIQSHLQKFFKRLRAAHPKYSLSYAACGELGDTFGRPHFHIILWSKYRNDTLTKEDIERAWSLKTVETKNPRIVKRWTYKAKDSKGKPIAPIYFQFGRVDFQDLVAEGDLNYLQATNLEDNNARKCFKYVATYVQKKTVTNKYAIKRMYRAFKQYPYNIVPTPHLFRSFQFGRYSTYQTVNTIDLVDDTPNRYVFDTDDDVYREVKHNNKTYEKTTFRDFMRLYAPFFVTSRTNSIGKDYALENLTRFKEKNFSLPKLWGKSLVFPQYYARLSYAAQNPLRLRKQSALSRSLVKGSMPSLFDYYKQLRYSRNYYTYIRSICQNTTPFAIFNDDRQPTRTKGEHPNGDGFLYDVTLDTPTGSIRYYYSPTGDFFEGYQYDRHKKEYYLVDVCNRIDFCDLVLSYLDKRADLFIESLPKRNKRLQLYEVLYRAKEQDFENVSRTMSDYVERHAINVREYKQLREHEARIDFE